jgi:glycosyltransferase involved in cell wall biosynthesis
MRPILIVTPFFAPQSHAAVFRAYKLAKFLPAHGYRPFVVTVDTNYDYREDPGLLAALPEEVSVVGAPYVEPTLRGVEYALGLRDRRLQAISNAAAPIGAASKGTSDGWREATHRLLLRGMLRIPDRHWPWFLPALSACRKIVREQGVRLALTSSDPFTSYLVGLALKRDGLTWVADLRDPPTHCAMMHSEYPWVYAVQREIERRAIVAADAVTVAAKSIELVLSELHGVELTGKAHFIPTGLDTSLLKIPAAAPGLPEGRQILFVGEYLQYYGERFFRWFSAARAEPSVQRLGYRVVVVGRIDVNRGLLDPIVQKYQLEGVVDFLDHQPQEALYAMIQRCEFGLLPYGDRRWWCLAAKLVDYLALQKPVLALVSDPSEARSRLTEAGLGIFLDGDESAAIERLVAALIAGGAAVAGDANVCRRYTVEHQVQEFVRVFDDVLVRGQSGRAS